MALGPASDQSGTGVERRNSAGALPGYPPEPNSEYRAFHPGVRTRGRSSALQRETTQTADQGPQRDAQWQRKWDRANSRDVGLEAATISKVRNSLPVEPSRAENERDSSVRPQSRGQRTEARGQRAAKTILPALCVLPSAPWPGRRASPSAAKPHRRGAVERRRVRMPERVTTRRVGSPSAESTRFPGEGQSAQGQSGPKARPTGVADGHGVNTPRPDGEVERGRTPARDGSGG